MNLRRFCVRALSAMVMSVLLAAPAGLVYAQPLGTAFPYQGRLADNGAPANGLYDFQFQIFDAAINGGQIGPTIVRDDVAVSGGLFTTSLDFGGGVFIGHARWLEIGVRPGASGGAFTPIGGRQELQPTPNALFAAATGGLVPPVTMNYAGADSILTAISTGQGNIGTPAIYSFVNNTEAARPGLKGEVNTIYGNDESAGVLGVTSGTGGFGGVFLATNGAGNGTALIASSRGSGSAFRASATGAGNGMSTLASGGGDGLVAGSIGGHAIRAFIVSATNNNSALDVTMAGTGPAALFESTNAAGTALRAVHNSGREARLGTNTHAGYFVGNVHVTGTLSKGAGSFKIDHPLDPANKYLSHSFVESPDMKNVYDGVTTLDANGEASITLPHYFEALNRDFRYQLTAVGGPAPSLHVARKISNGVFRIAGGTPGLEISWQITGIRKDQTALHNPIVVEQDKSGDDRGLYLDPAAFGLPAEKGIGWRPREGTATAPNQQ